MKEAFIKIDRFGFVTQVSCHLLLGETRQPGAQTQGPSLLTRVDQKYSEAGFPMWEQTWFTQAGFPLLPPLHSTLAQRPASTNRAAGTPTNQSAAKICVNQSEAALLLRVHRAHYSVRVGMHSIKGWSVWASPDHLAPATCTGGGPGHLKTFTPCAGKKREGGVDDSGVCCQGAAALHRSTPRTAFPHVLLTTSPSHNRVSTNKILATTVATTLSRQIRTTRATHATHKYTQQTNK